MPQAHIQRPVQPNSMPIRCSQAQQLESSALKFQKRIFQVLLKRLMMTSCERFQSRQGAERRGRTNLNDGEQKHRRQHLRRLASFRVINRLLQQLERATVLRVADCFDLEMFIALADEDEGSCLKRTRQQQGEDSQLGGGSYVTVIINKCHCDGEYDALRTILLAT